VQQTVSFDVDGVLADFTRGFTRIAHELFGTPVGDHSYQPTWMFEEFPALGLTKPMVKEVWDVIKTHSHFWAKLDPLNVSVMNLINKIDNAVYITNRPGIHTGWQTVMFLRKWGVNAFGRVYVAADKPSMMRKLNVVAHIDDWEVNVKATRAALPHVYAPLLATSYNVPFHNEPPVLYSVDQYIHECDARGFIRWKSRGFIRWK
jgi:hypothetical protein